MIFFIIIWVLIVMMKRLIILMVMLRKFLFMDFIMQRVMNIEIVIIRIVMVVVVREMKQLYLVVIVIMVVIVVGLVIRGIVIGMVVKVSMFFFFFECEYVIVFEGFKVYFEEDEIVCNFEGVYINVEYFLEDYLVGDGEVGQENEFDEVCFDYEGFYVFYVEVFVEECNQEYFVVWVYYDEYE